MTAMLRHDLEPEFLLCGTMHPLMLSKINRLVNIYNSLLVFGLKAEMRRASGGLTDYLKGDTTGTAEKVGIDSGKNTLNLN